MTSDAYADLLDAAPQPVSPTIGCSSPGPHGYTELARRRRSRSRRRGRGRATTCTSSSSPRDRPGFPKAVRCTQGRFARTGMHVRASPALGPGSAVYAPLPFFHSSFVVHRARERARRRRCPIATPRQVLGVTAPCPTSGAWARRCWRTPARSSTTSSRCRRRPTTPTSPLEFAFGNEASESDIREFAARFDCQVRDSYGSTEGMIVIRRDASMPRGSLGRADDNIDGVRPRDRAGVPARRVRRDGALAERRRGGRRDREHRRRPTRFEGYYRNEEAPPRRSATASTGPATSRTATRTAGSSSPAARTSGCASTARTSPPAPVERIVLRHPACARPRCTRCPTIPVGDRVMVAVEVDDLDAFDVDEFDDFVAAQPDLGPKWVPSFVRVEAELPKLASMKLDKSGLRREGWNVPGVSWRPKRGEPTATDDAVRRRRAGAPAAVNAQAAGPASARRPPMTIDDAGRVFTDPKAYADEARFHAACAQLRRESPVHRVEADGLHAVLGGDEARRRDGDRAGIRPLAQRAAARARPEGARREARTDMPVRTLVQMDAPDHTVYRHISVEWFKPGNIARLGDRAAELAKRSVDRMAELGGECDFVDRHRRPLPALHDPLVARPPRGGLPADAEAHPGAVRHRPIPSWAAAPTGTPCSRRSSTSSSTSRTSPSRVGRIRPTISRR